MHRVGPAVALLGNLAVATACAGPTCDTDSGEPTRYSTGWNNADETFYMTGAVDEPFLHFPSGRTYLLEHGLSSTPQSYGAWQAFNACPFSSEKRVDGEPPQCHPIEDTGDTSGAAFPAGNQLILDRITTEFIEVRNDTCSEFYLRIWASALPQN